MKEKNQSVKNKSKKVEEVATKPVVAPEPLPPLSADNIDYSLRSAELSFNTEVYDDGDIASALELTFMAHAIEMHKSKVAPETHPDFDGKSCIDCGETIHEVRLNMGKIRCIDCQSILEKKNKLRG